MSTTRNRLGSLAALLGLLYAGSAWAQVAGYNPYTGRGGRAGAAYNPYTGTSAAGQT